MPRPDVRYRPDAGGSVIGVRGHRELRLRPVEHEPAHLDRGMAGFVGRVRRAPQLALFDWRLELAADSERHNGSSHPHHDFQCLGSPDRVGRVTEHELRALGDRL
jgi:hypothetical protein